MKIKVKPEDFIVREKSLLPVRDRPGPYRVYRLRKKQWDSFDLLDLLARRLNVDREDLSLGGHKDRYGDSEQLLAVRNREGLPEKFEEGNISLVQEGYAERRLQADQVAGNSFRLTLRDLAPAEIDRLKQNCLAVRASGFPNYYDEQRFGSARGGRGFLGKALFLGRMEEALKIYLTPHPADRREEREFKEKARSLWRQWKKIDLSVPPRFTRVFDVLNAPGGYMAFNQAVNAIDRDLIILALHAYQSFLFNRLAARYLGLLALEQAIGPLAVLPFAYGDLAFYDRLDKTALERLKAVSLPVPGHDTRTEDPLVQKALDAVLAEEGIGLSNLKVKKLHGKAVRGKERPLIVLPEEFAFDDPADDELYPGKKKLRLLFFLPRGSYATMLIKRISLGL